MGWFGISFISTIRIVGAGCMLGTITNGSRAVWAAIFVLTQWHFRIPELICWAGLAISIADYALAAQKTDNAMAPGSLTRAGVGLFAALYFWGVLLFMLLAKQWKQIPQADMRAMIGFAGCFPFMVVRISYTIAYVSTGERRFSAVSGDKTTYLLMTFLMEFAVLGFVVWTIWGLDPVYKQLEKVRGQDTGEMEDLVESHGQRSWRSERRLDSQ
ncbi:hypothetical protein CORC01_02757 [Colletotrichum orchidophilum]|uniref:DUF7702 domain-containing protein n=1 Tax=Colletotrichum orchidophilum TaxID=1209926 RepID=A0A1G4BKA4_9PEZI|nr:uncharacterized protein CORC01_02757 [Colletotrichum orchidophilum]OHF01879.1 hypothetical protein CORC01_02757 [Colletotrichum orchidophilum]